MHKTTCSIPLDNITTLVIFLQFVYLRDNLLSSLEGVEILKCVKVCFLTFFKSYFHAVFYCII